MKTRASVIRRDTLNALFYTLVAAAALLIPELMFGSERNAITDNISGVMSRSYIASSSRVRIQGSLSCDGVAASSTALCSLKTLDDGNTKLIQISGFLKKGIAERVIELYRTGKTTVAVEGDLSSDRRTIELSEVDSI